VRQAPAVASFGYHDVTDDPAASGFQRPAALPFKLGCSTFAEHLDHIAAGVRVPELIGGVDLTQPGHHVLLTFDDGGKSAVRAGDELARRGWKGHFFIITSRVGERTFLDPAEIRYLRGCGHAIGSHSHTHPNLFRELSPARMHEEWRVSRDWLTQLLGEPCLAASVPGGDLSARVQHSAANAGFKYLFTSEPTVTPDRVAGCWILGRFVAKRRTSPARVGELARLHGWGRAMLLRRMKVGARLLLPGLYRRYVHRGTAADAAAPLRDRARSS
jgi:peptidoglycan/xylan/chitin deacetylase (PgdA/CDA1 family)